MNLTYIPFFSDTSAWALALLASVYIGAFMVRGVLGIGAMPVIVLFGALLLDSHHAVLLAMLVVTYTQIMFVPESFRNGDWRLIYYLAIGYTPTVVVGVWIFGYLRSNELGVVIGLLLIGVILVDKFFTDPKTQKFESQLPHYRIVLIGAVSGLISGIVGAGSLILLSVFIKPLYVEARRFRATILLVSILGSIWRFSIQTFKGLITVPLVAESLLLAPFAFLGSYLGIRLFESIVSETYFKAFRYFLLFAALIIIIRSLLGAF